MNKYIRKIERQFRFSQREFNGLYSFPDTILNNEELEHTFDRICDDIRGEFPLSSYQFDNKKQAEPLIAMLKKKYNTYELSKYCFIIEEHSAAVLSGPSFFIEEGHFHTIFIVIDPKIKRENPETEILAQWVDWRCYNCKTSVTNSKENYTILTDEENYFYCPECNAPEPKRMKFLVNQWNKKSKEYETTYLYTKK